MAFIPKGFYANTGSGFGKFIKKIEGMDFSGPSRYQKIAAMGKFPGFKDIALSKGTLGTATLGAALGGMYGGYSENESVLGGALKGTAIGAAVPVGLFGAGKAVHFAGSSLAPKNTRFIKGRNSALADLEKLGVKGQLKASQVYGATGLMAAGRAMKNTGKLLANEGASKYLKPYMWRGLGHAAVGGTIGAAGWLGAGILKKGYEFEDVPQQSLTRAIAGGAAVGLGFFGAKLAFKPINAMVKSGRPVKQKDVFQTASSGIMKASGIVAVHGAFGVAAAAQGFRFTQPTNR